MYIVPLISYKGLSKNLLDTSDNWCKNESFL